MALDCVDGFPALGTPRCCTKTHGIGQEGDGVRVRVSESCERGALKVVLGSTVEMSTVEMSTVEMTRP